AFAVPVPIEPASRVRSDLVLQYRPVALVGNFARGGQLAYLSTPDLGGGSSIWHRFDLAGPVTSLGRVKLSAPAEKSLRTVEADVYSADLSPSGERLATRAPLNPIGVWSTAGKLETHYKPEKDNYTQWFGFLNDTELLVLMKTGRFRVLEVPAGAIKSDK